MSSGGILLWRKREDLRKGQDVSNMSPRDRKQECFPLSGTLSWVWAVKSSQTSSQWERHWLRLGGRIRKYSEELTLPKGGLAFALGSWEVSLECPTQCFIYLEGSRATLDNRTKWSMGGVLGHMVSAQPLDETKGQPHGQPTSLRDQTPYKRWTPRLRWASLVGNTLCVLSHIVVRKS